jgi:hypothetical protein
MSGNYVGIGNYADADDVTTDVEAFDGAAELEGEDVEETRMSIIVHD